MKRVQVTTGKQTIEVFEDQVEQMKAVGYRVVSEKPIKKESEKKEVKDNGKA